MSMIHNIEETVSAFDAKTHLSQLLHEVEAGHIITITRRGKPVAKLVPYSDVNKIESKSDVLKHFNEVRKRVKGRVNIKSYIDEGRKY